MVTRRYTTTLIEFTCCSAQRFREYTSASKYRAASGGGLAKQVVRLCAVTSRGGTQYAGLYAGCGGSGRHSRYASDTAALYRSFAAMHSTGSDGQPIQLPLMDRCMIESHCQRKEVS